MRTKHVVTYIHKISNRRDSAGLIPGYVTYLDMGALQRAGGLRALAKSLREQGVLCANTRVREARFDGDLLLVFPTLPGCATYHHCVSIQITETYATIPGTKS